MRAACDVVSEGGALVDELGTLVYHLPQRTTAPVARLLRTIAERNELVVIAALTGVPKADAEVIAGIERLGGAIDLEQAGVIPAAGTAVCSTSDADDEVRVIVRGIVDAMREGVPLERMAVVFGNAEPYACCTTTSSSRESRTTACRCERSPTPCSADRCCACSRSPTTTSAEKMCARSWPARRCSTVGRLVEAAAWERISRDAGVVGSVGQWARLARFVAARSRRCRSEAMERSTCPELPVTIPEMPIPEMPIPEMPIPEDADRRCRSRVPDPEDADPGSPGDQARASAERASHPFSGSSSAWPAVSNEHPLLGRILSALGARSIVAPPPVAAA